MNEILYALATPSFKARLQPLIEAEQHRRIISMGWKRDSIIGFLGFLLGLVPLLAFVLRPLWFSRGMLGDTRWTKINTNVASQSKALLTVQSTTAT
jgi:hypothetical protein